MSDPTSRPSFNDQSRSQEKTPPPKRHRNYTHHQLLDQLDRYASRARTKEQHDEILKRKKKYKEHVDFKDIRQARRQEYFMGGQARGLHAHMDLYDLHQQKLEHEQFKRNKIAREAKEFYHKNYSASKDFSDTKGELVKKPAKEKSADKTKAKTDPPKPKKGAEKMVTERFKRASGKVHKNYQIDRAPANTNPARTKQKSKGMDKSK